MAGGGVGVGVGVAACWVAGAVASAAVGVVGAGTIEERVFQQATAKTMTATRTANGNNRRLTTGCPPFPKIVSTLAVLQIGRASGIGLGVRISSLSAASQPVTDVCEVVLRSILPPGSNAR